MKKIEADIVELRKQGKSYNEIETILQCSKGLVSYYCTRNNLVDIGLRNLNITDDIIKEWQEYCDTHTLKNAAEHFGVSATTLKRYGVIGKRKRATIYAKIERARLYTERDKNDTNHKGELAQSAVVFDLIKQGYAGICTPISWTAPYDLVVFIDDAFKRIQIKHVHEKEGRITVKTTRNIDARQGMRKVQSFTNNEFDILAIYCPDTDCCYYIRRDLFGDSVTLLLRKTKNNQTGSRYADDYRMIR